MVSAVKPASLGTVDGSCPYDSIRVELMAASKKDWSPELAGLGGRARHARERMGYGVREAAEALGVHNSSISRLEDGTRLVDVDTMIRLARLYHAPLGWLLAEEVPLPPLDEATERAVGDRRRSSGAGS